MALSVFQQKQAILRTAYWLQFRVPGNVIGDRLAAAFPDATAADLDQILGQGQALYGRMGRFSLPPPASPLSAVLPPGGQPLGARATVDTVVAITPAVGSPIYRTLRLSLPWDITIQEYQRRVMGLVAFWRVESAARNIEVSVWAAVIV